MKALLCTAACLTFFGTALAQNPDQAPRRPRPQQPTAATEPGTAAAEPFRAVEKKIEWVRTKHTWNGSLPYTATVGFIPIKNEKGDLEAQMFFEAYTKDDADPTRRPITFAFNGGPGSSSVWLHMGALGPRRARMNDDGTLPPPPFEFVENKESWLPDTDIVMIDAIGTGYSRTTKPDEKKFYGLQGDLNAFTAFIKGFLTETHRWRSPIIVAGESYGGIRVAGLSDSLLREGIAVNGIISISGVMNFQTIDGGKDNDLPFMTYLPSYTATALYHHRLKPQFQSNPERTIAQAENFANGEYNVALTKGSALSPAERKHIAAKLADYTGLSPLFIDRSNLRINGGAFRAELLRDTWETVGRYDARLRGFNSNGNAQFPEYDASDTAVTPVFTATFNDYIDRELKFHSEETYRTTGYAYIGAWDYGNVDSYPDTSENLRRALTRNPHMQVMLVCGRYDLACPYFAMQFTMDHLFANPELRKNIHFAYYPSGHMVYIEKSSREKLARDVSAFVHASVR